MVIIDFEAKLHLIFWPDRFLIKVTLVSALALFSTEKFREAAEILSGASAEGQQFS